MTEAKLIVSGPQTTKEVLLDPKGTTLGRASDCDVTLDDVAVSRLHARIFQDPFGRWIVEDVGSQNGVFIDGHRVKAQAILPSQEINIRPFTLSLSKKSDQTLGPGKSIRSTASVFCEGSREDVISWGSDRVSALSPDLIRHLNQFAGRLLTLSSPTELYSEACLCLAEVLDTLVAIVRLPCHNEPLAPSPDVLACHFGTADTNTGVLQESHLHLSKRVLEAVRSKDAPVMAGGGPASDQNLRLTIDDTRVPHLVFSARVNDLGETIDVLYVDILEENSPTEMLGFVEAAARQVAFAQQSLFFAELKKKEQELREANAKLREKDRIKDEYVVRVTHDIKGHLGAIQSLLDLAAGDTLGSLNAKQSDVVSRALKRTGQLTGFVRDLLNLTRMRLSGRSKAESFSVAACISKALANVAEKAEQKAITVSSYADVAVGDIRGDEVSVTEMLTNLLFNAVTYTPDQKSVHLEARGHSDHVEIEIADTGIGIPADEIDNVFDEFFRARNAKENERHGTGLGLAIVKQIVGRHGGHVVVDSRQDQGSKFTVILPRGGSSHACS